jgi:hypothetical protein
MVSPDGDEGRGISQQGHALKVADAAIAVAVRLPPLTGEAKIENGELTNPPPPGNDVPLLFE